MKVGDQVKHPDYPDAEGHIDRMVYIGRNAYYSVVWPWRASPGPNILYAVSATILKKA